MRRRADADDPAGRPLGPRDGMPRERAKDGAPEPAPANPLSDPEGRPRDRRRRP